MKKLVPKETLAKVVGLNKRNPLLALLSSVTKLTKLNDLYDRIRANKGTAFIEAFFQELQITIQLNEEELQFIPETGGCVIVCNHPFGAIDGLALIQQIEKRRPDLKVMANFLLEEIPEIAPYFFSVNPFDKNVVQLKSERGLKRCIEHIANGGCLAIFPAGEVSTFQKKWSNVSDKKWQRSVMKLIQRAECPVVPVFFDGRNSRMFHLLGKVNPQLRTMALPSELFKKEGDEIKMRIGKSISASDIAVIQDSELLGRFLRAKVYSLGSELHVKKKFFQNFRRKIKEPSEIAAPLDANLLIQEIEANEDSKLFDNSNYSVYALKASSAPNVLLEIGRQREIAFRAVGEGSNHTRDIDEFDYYYYHLVLWDREKNSIAGAYRIGRGAEIMEFYGKHGFYTHTLFRFKREFQSYLQESVELGRSYVAVEYQRQRLPLFLLWEGIIQMLSNFKEAKYIIGPVSMSNDYQALSKELVIEFIQKNFGDENLSQLVKPRTKIRNAVKKVDKEALILAAGGEIKKFDRLLAAIEPMGKTMPVLYKKYLAQNAKILAFNRDRKFNDAIDAFMILDIQNLPTEKADKIARG
jgi:putative hemolysin